MARQQSGTKEKPPTPFNLAVGANLRALWAAVGGSQAQLGRDAGLSPQMMNHCMQGKRPLEPEAAARLCEKHGCTLDFVYRGIRTLLPGYILDKLPPPPPPAAVSMGKSRRAA